MRSVPSTVIFLVTEKGTLMPLGNRQAACCSIGEPASDCPADVPSALEGRGKSVAFTARQWSLPMVSVPRVCTGDKTVPAQDDLDRFLARARTHTFSISAMAFQDMWNLDLERLRGCCVHVISPEGMLIPFCAYNLTSSTGKPLYRGGGRP